MIGEQPGYGFLEDKAHLLTLSPDHLLAVIEDLRRRLEAADTRILAVERWRNLVAGEVDSDAAFADIPRLIRELKARAETDVMTPLSHYIVVRRDLSFGLILSMVAHAAGESFYALGRGSSEKERLLAKQEVGGSSPSPGSIFNPAKTIAVVLGARNEGRLAKLATALTSAGVRFVEIRETEGEYAGQFLAIGIVPGDKAVIAPLVRDFHMFKELEATS